MGASGNEGRRERGIHTTHPPPRKRRHIELLSAAMPVRELDLLCLIDDEVECTQAVFGVEFIPTVLGSVALDAVLVVVVAIATIRGGEGEGESGSRWGGDFGCGGKAREERECEGQ